MILRMRPLLLAAVLLATSMPTSRAQTYERVNATNLLQGYVPEGTRVEVSGHIGSKDGIVAFKTNRISAAAPMTVETQTLPRGLAELIARQCAWDGLTVGGCSATVRGTVLSKRSRSIAADDIVIDAARNP